jgi:UrcA family protein
MNSVRIARVTRFVSGLVFGVSMLALNATAFAEPAAPTVKISYADLDLNNSADVKVLYRRLASASAAVCGQVDHSILPMTARQQACYRQALEQAVLQVHSPALISLYQAKQQHGSALG